MAPQAKRTPEEPLPTYEQCMDELAVVMAAAVLRIRRERTERAKAAGG